MESTSFSARIKPTATIGIGAAIAIVGLVIVVYGIKQQRG
jgi:hypothetical protein